MAAPSKECGESGQLEPSGREAWLADEPLIEVRSPELRALAARITADLPARAVRHRAERVAQSVNTHMEYEVTPEAIGTTQLSLAGAATAASSAH